MGFITHQLAAFSLRIFLTFSKNKFQIYHWCVFIFKSNPFACAKVRGAAKTRCRATCIGATRSVTPNNDFHVEILATPPP
jgi:hypothetical protein